MEFNAKLIQIPFAGEWDLDARSFLAAPKAVLVDSENQVKGFLRHVQEERNRISAENAYL